MAETSSNGEAAPRKKTVTEMAHDAFRRFGYGWFDEQGKWHPPEEPRPGGNTDGAQQSRSPNTDAIKRARAYVAKIPPAISGQGGHNQTFRVACELVLGFNLTIAEAMPLLREYSERCQPPWTEKELLHKLRTADAKTGERGHRLKISNNGSPVDYKADGRFDEKEFIYPRDIDKYSTAFPLDAFPPQLQKYVLDVATAKQCPVDFAACAVLSVASACMGNSRAISVTNDWNETPILYLMMVAPPSAGKSPALREIRRPIKATQQKRKNDYEEKMKIYKKALRAWREGEDGAGMPEKPVFEHVYVQDITSERLIGILAQCPRGLLVFRDEAVSWVLSMNQYRGGKGADRQLYLSLWSGEDQKTDRKKDEESVLVDRPFISILGGIQPDMLNAMLDEMGREDGFVQRLLFTFPRKLRRSEKFVKAEVTKEQREFWERVCQSLMSVQMQVNQDGTLRPRLVKFTAEGAAVWESWYEEHTKEINQFSFSEGMESSWTKMYSYSLRLALIVHFIRIACGEVSHEDVDGASAAYGCLLTNYFKQQTRKVHDTIQDNSRTLKINLIVKWIKNNGGTATSRELVHNNVGGITKVSEAQTAMKEMADMMYGRYEIDGRAWKFFLANPKDTKTVG